MIERVASSKTVRRALGAARSGPSSPMSSSRYSTSVEAHGLGGLETGRRPGGGVDTHRQLTLTIRSVNGAPPSVMAAQDRDLSEPLPRGAVGPRPRGSRG